MNPLIEFLVLITGFMAGLRCWLGVYDLIVANRMKGIEKRRKVFTALGRFGSALAFGILTYSLAVPGDNTGGDFIFRLTMYTAGALLLLVGSVGELSVYEWREGEQDYLDPATVRGLVREAKEQDHRDEQTKDIEERRDGEVK